MPDMNCTELDWLACSIPLDTVSETVCGTSTICNWVVYASATILSLVVFIVVGLLGEWFAILCVDVCIPYQVYAVERLIVARQGVIVRHVRAIQRLPIFPRALYIASETDPGLTKRKIRKSANFLVLPFAISLFTLMISWVNNVNVLQQPLALVLGLIIPVVYSLGVWITLAIAHNCRPEHLKPNETEKGNAIPLDEADRILDFAEIKERVRKACPRELYARRENDGAPVG
ncbi:hypothetical protein GGR57DRAFT_503896 [Xylariaceae sp. FL1272]|nr:hypothetical protein GGR57DRAFT_503896 [Xylariaceae sp. FL1272]